jgi:CspA family cold shock protein
VDPDEVVAGSVVRWSDDGGWGVLRSDALDGSVFAHFSMIRDQAGYRSLAPGQQVWFRWERPGQDGCAARAVDVYGAGPPGPDAPSGPPAPRDRPDAAYRASLTVTGDDPPGGSPPRRP